MTSTLYYVVVFHIGHSLELELHNKKKYPNMWLMLEHLSFQFIHPIDFDTHNLVLVFIINAMTASTGIISVRLPMVSYSIRRNIWKMTYVIDFFYAHTLQPIPWWSMHPIRKIYV